MGCVGREGEGGCQVPPVPLAPSPQQLGTPEVALGTE